MTKQEFLASLREGIRGLPPADMEEHVAFYDEMIDDRMEEGLTEAQAVAELGPVENVIAQIAAETPLLRLVKEKVRKERQRSGKGISTALLIVGSPIWGSLLIAAAAVVFSLAVSAWAAVVSLYAAAVSLIAGGAGCIAGSVVYFFKGNVPGAAFVIGGGLAAVGLGLMLFIGCNALAKGLARGMKNMILGCKSLMIGKKGEE